jgi:hypothetical protein
MGHRLDDEENATLEGNMLSLLDKLKHLEIERLFLSTRSKISDICSDFVEKRKEFQTLDVGMY